MSGNRTSRLTEDNHDRPDNHRLTDDSRKYTVQEAAEVLGTSVDAVRGRIRRGTLDSMKVDGQVFVLLDTVSREQHTDCHPPNQDDSRQQSELVAELRNQIEWLRREVERKDTIIMTMAQRIPELEPASSASTDEPESRETASSVAGNGTGRPEPEKVRERRWWQFWR